MIRKSRMEQDAERERERNSAIRWRGGDVSRLEGFSDAVFGFALTLLVVSLEVPKTFEALLAIMRGFAGFGLCFLTLFMIWRRHYTFFRHYGLQDPLTVSINGLLLFVILLYVYPLKFLYSLVLNIIPVFRGASSVGIGMTYRDFSRLFVIYGLGFAAVYFIFALLYLNALRQRETLQLNPCELALTRLEAIHNILMMSVGLFSVCLALFLPLSKIGLAGWAYTLIGLVESIHGRWEGNARRHWPELAANDASEPI